MAKDLAKLLDFGLAWPNFKLAWPNFGHLPGFFRHCSRKGGKLKLDFDGKCLRFYQVGLQYQALGSFVLQKSFEQVTMFRWSRDEFRWRDAWNI